MYLSLKYTYVVKQIWACPLSVITFSESPVPHFTEEEKIFWANNNIFENDADNITEDQLAEDHSQNSTFNRHVDHFLCVTQLETNIWEFFQNTPLKLCKHYEVTAFFITKNLVLYLS